MHRVKFNIARVLVQEDKFLHEENLLLQRTLTGYLEISFFPQSPHARPAWRLCCGQRGLLHLHQCCHFFRHWSLRSSRLPVKHLSLGANSLGLEFASGQTEPLPNTTRPDYALHVGGTGIEALYGASHPCFPARIRVQPSLLSLWTVAPLKQVSLEIFFASSGLAVHGRWGRSAPSAPWSGRAEACWQHLGRISPLTQLIYATTICCY